MDVVVGQLFTGLSIGSILLLAALGLSLTFGQMGVINMAHGEFIMAGCYTAYVVQQIMAASGAATITLNPFESTTTVTKQIVDLLTGEAAFASAKTLAAFALGLTLFVVTLLLNVVALMVVRRYREAYE